MKVECPHCKEQYDVDPKYTGQQIKCPKCKNDFQVMNDKLAPCPDCCMLISKRAFECPKCGAPLQGKAMNPSDGDISQERKLAVYHPSAWNYLGWITLGIITLPVVVGLIILICVIIDIKCSSYELTTHRVIVRQGLIAKLQNEIWIKDMRGVNLKQSVWQRIIGIGNIEIGTAASAGTEISITGIARPAEVVSRINSLR